MDDGTLIKLVVQIDVKTGDTTFDFSGSGLQVISTQ
jgi:N-methylhydantoinase B/oxoprolinase/acetone carboxylase alpha subunit